MSHDLPISDIIVQLPYLSNKQQQQIMQLFDLYTFWNSQINVISRKDMAHFYERHVLHSLYITHSITLYPQQTVMDIGTGGGFPGIPLAIIYPDTQFILVDSIGKKLKVVKAVVEALGIENVTTIWDRAEDIPLQVDTITARAVMPLSKICTIGKKLLDKKSPFDSAGIISLKGGDLATEIQEAGVRPLTLDLHILSHRNDYFQDKYILFIPTKNLKT